MARHRVYVNAYDLTRAQRVHNNNHAHIPQATCGVCRAHGTAWIVPTSARKA